MAEVIGFDVYGTLIDTSGVTTVLTKFAGDRAPAFAALWREKQLEYSFRRGLMQNYRNFGTCTRDALNYSCEALDITIAEDDKNALMAGYRYLPPFNDVQTALPKLSQRFSLYAFSNGRAEDVATLLENAAINSYFTDIISTDEMKSFKPNPAVYAHFMRRAGTSSGQSWLISGNPFDVIGAISAGMRGAWVKRSDKALFDPWEIQPTATVSQLTELAEAINACEKRKE